MPKKHDENEEVLVYTRHSIKTGWDQSNGLLSDKTVDMIMKLYDVKTELLCAVTDAMNEIINDYARTHKLEYD